MAFLEVSHLQKAYNSVPAVNDFSLSLDKGKIYALVGPDGAGKTTIIRTLCNLVRPDKGTIVIDNMDVFSQFDMIKPLLGYMPQVFSLYPDLSVEENLVFHAGIYGVMGDKYRTRRDEMYRFSHLKPFANRRAGDLSGGMKQKLALSCALMHDPSLLVLDEPTTGVDPLSRSQFWDVLLRLKTQGVAILLTTPYMDEVARADNACFIFEGRKMAEGSPDELVRIFDGSVFFINITPDARTIERLNNIENVSATRFGAGLHLYLPSDHSPEQYRVELTSVGINPSIAEPIEPDLEDCFIQMIEKAV